MKLKRTENAARNIVFGSILKGYQIIIPFMLRTVMIYSLGVEYLGLNSLFTSVLSVLNLAELGVGSAMVYSMYKAIAAEDESKISALLNLYKKYYQKIGAIILVLGIGVLPFIKNFIGGEIPSDINVYLIYLMNLIATVLSYWLFAYKSSILQAFQRNDVISKITLLTDTMKYALQIYALIFLRNYYYYLLIQIFSQIISNFLIAKKVLKMYPKYQPIGYLDEEEVRSINRRIRDLFTLRLGGAIVNSADTIVISTFLGLTTLAIYQNYYYIISAVIGIIGVFLSSLTAGIGNSLITETIEKNYADFKKITFAIIWILGWATACFLCIFQDFMLMWVGRELQYKFSAVILFCVYFFTFELNQLLCLYKDAAGMWREDRARPIITALTNLILNIIFVKYIGIYGVLLSTILSTVLIGSPWLVISLFRTVFIMDYKQYMFNILNYVIKSGILCIITYALTILINPSNIIGLIFKFIMVSIISNTILYIFYRKTLEYSFFKEKVTSIILKR